MQIRPLVLAFVLLTTAAFAQDVPVRFTLAGSSTVTRVLMPLKAGVEAAHHAEIRLVPNGSGRGLAELATGRADAAMISGPLDDLLRQLALTADRELRSEQLEKLKLADSPKAELVALVHPGNRVRQLTTEQLRSILVGAITDWSALGGPAQPINVILPDSLDGVRATLATALLAGREFTASAQIVERTPDIPALVAEDSGAIGVLPRGMLAVDSACAEITPKLALALYIVARKERLEEDPKLETLLNSLHSRAR
ncbi:MAG TPA: substrate-binding domain-containing protein [Opitutaceae bacterium]|nr:substrate-binding domain-containing protein [Opitutaceae bacterium]